MKKEKEEFHVAVLKLQEQMTTLELEKDDLEQYGRRVSVRINDEPVEFEEVADSVYEKVQGSMSVLTWYVSSINRAHRIGSEYKLYRNKEKNVAAL